MGGFGFSLAPSQGNLELRGGDLLWISKCAQLSLVLHFPPAASSMGEAAPDAALEHLCELFRS